MVAKEIAIFLLTIVHLCWVDLKKEKNKLDEKKKDFRFLKDWFKFRWDECGSWFIGGTLGALLADELAIPAIEKYLDWNELIEKGLDLTSVFFMTLIGAIFFERIYERLSRVSDDKL